MDSHQSDNSSKTHGANHSQGKEHQAPSTTELMSSAKVVADAARAKMNNEEFDQAKAAGAAADVLCAASHYGKLDESKGMGKMVDMAEDYLHNYSTTTKTTTTLHAGDAHSTITTQETTTHTPGKPTDGDGHGKSGHGGYGGYMKMAEGLLKPGGDNKAHGGESGGGHDKAGGGYLKMAGDFMKKN